MTTKSIKRNLILGILFFLPVLFLLMLYPSTHNYNPLDIVNENVSDLQAFTSDSHKTIRLKDQITVLGFLGNQPMNKAISASNLKELVYDKFKGFKKFQIVVLVPLGSEAQVQLLKQEINAHEDLKYWHFVYGDQNEINKVYKSLTSDAELDDSLATDHVFIIDKDLNQRGRIDDRSDNEIAIEATVVSLESYDTIEVAIIKNKMSEDVRILFTEYRQKRKGEFDSSTRRADNLKQNNEQEN